MVRIKMKVTQKWLGEIYEDSVAGVEAAILLGDKFINITKGKSSVTVKDGATLKSAEGGDIPELMKRAGDMLGTFQVLVNRFDTLLGDIEAGKGNVGKFIKDEELYNQLTGAAKELNKLMVAVTSGKGTLGRLMNDEQLYQEIRSPINRLDSMLAEMQQGQGTAGKFLKDPALYDDARKAFADLYRMINVDLKKIVNNLSARKGTAGVAFTKR